MSYWWDIIYKYRYKQGKRIEDIRIEQQELKKFSWKKIDAYIEKEFCSEEHRAWSYIDRPLNESELKSIASNPLVSIGNHTHRHAILTNYTKDEIIKEISSCNEYVAEKTGTEPISIAFPNGNFNENTLTIAQETGMRVAFTTQNHINAIPINNDKIICLGRFMAKTEKIRKYGSFMRLGYNSENLYNKFKKGINNLIK